MMNKTKERKSKFTASVTKRLVAMVDEKCTQLNLSRSDAVEQAMELWLRQQEELEDEEYFASAAKEMNDDASDWTALTTRTFTQ